MTAFRQDDLYVEMTFLRTTRAILPECFDPGRRDWISQQRATPLVRQQRRTQNLRARHRAHPTPATRSSTSAPNT